MKNEIEIIRKIKQQLAHCMASYGDQPDELMYKLETLVIEWYGKGLETNKPIEITCPHCKFEITVYHMEWSAIICGNCDKQINQIEK